jgi:methylated-DNA-[protein]-cysteine S-methyltransferase
LMLEQASSADTPCVYCEIATPLGSMRLLACAGSLRGVWFVDQHQPPLAQGGQDDARHPVLAQAVQELTQWFAGQRQRFTPALSPVGTPFQQHVWRALCEVPFGSTISYGALACTIGHPNAARAVGGAIGRNPLSIFIPCHRVVGHDTALTGFAAGLARKQALLAHEGHRYLGASASCRRVCNQQAEWSW